MSNRLIVNPSTAMGKLALEVATNILVAQQSMVRLKQACDMMVYGTPQDNATLEGELGLAPGGTNGADFFALISLTQGALSNDDISQYVRRVDQG